MVCKHKLSFPFHVVSSFYRCKILICHISNLPYSIGHVFIQLLDNNANAGHVTTSVCHRLGVARSMTNSNDVISELSPVGSMK